MLIDNLHIFSFKFTSYQRRVHAHILNYKYLITEKIALTQVLEKLTPIPSHQSKTRTSSLEAILALNIIPHLLHALHFTGRTPRRAALYETHLIQLSSIYLDYIAWLLFQTTLKNIFGKSQALYSKLLKPLDIYQRKFITLFFGLHFQMNPNHHLNIESVCISQIIFCLDI